MHSVLPHLDGLRFTTCTPWSQSSFSFFSSRFTGISAQKTFSTHFLLPEKTQSVTTLSLTWNSRKSSVAREIRKNNWYLSVKLFPILLLSVYGSLHLQTLWESSWQCNSRPRTFTKSLDFPSRTQVLSVLSHASQPHLWKCQLAIPQTNWGAAPLKLQWGFSTV